MQPSVWNYLLGYVMIQVEGQGIERFVNLSLQNGIGIWGVRRKSRLTITAYVTLEDFYKLRPLVRKLHCKVHIVRKRGVPFALIRRRSRGVLLLGWILVLAALFVASRYVWFIDVEGCYQIEEAEVRRMLDDMSVKSGMARSGLAAADIGKQLKAMDGRIAWAGASVSGVVLKVEIVEAAEEPNSPKDTSPVSIYAAKDGVITEILALKGKPQVELGQAVQAGDLLINGDLRTEGAPGYMVHADGTVRAKVAYSFSVKAGPELTSLARTGRSSDYTEVWLFGRCIKSGAGEFQNYETELERESPINGVFLPLVVKSGKCYELQETAHTATETELRETVIIMADQKLSSIIPKNARILSKSSELTLQEDGSVVAVINVTTEEDIGEVRSITDSPLP